MKCLNNNAKIVSVWQGWLLHCFFVSLYLVTLLREVTARNSDAQKFPGYFWFGAGSAAYQIEGAWNADGRGPSMWDHMIHTDPSSIMDKSNADVASNSYYFYRKDISILKELGVQSYRFSISWTRILPNGRKDYINQPGLMYYNNLINELLANGIEPFVTIYQFDLPQTLSKEGGWLNEKVIEWFEDYAEIVFANFGDRVKYWLTVNEPYVHCYLGYEEGIHPPRIKNPGVGIYECARNLILASAKAYRLYEKKFKATQRGLIGLALSSEWADTATGKEDDMEAAKDFVLFTFDLLAHPIFSKEGNYPEEVIRRVAAKSTAQGYQCSRLRPFTPEQVNFIRGSADFLGLNHYTTVKIYRNDSRKDKNSVPSLEKDAGIGIERSADGLPTAQNSVNGEPSGLYSLLFYIQKKYGMPIYITENGYSSKPGLEDYDRVNYLRNYLNATLNAITDGANVRGYFAWSLMDNFEWTVGYLVRYGLYEIDFDDPNRTGTPRESAHVYKDIITTKTIH